jgi:hypothetical protein
MGVCFHEATKMEETSSIVSNEREEPQLVLLPGVDQRILQASRGTDTSKAYGQSNKLLLCSTKLSILVARKRRQRRRPSPTAMRTSERASEQEIERDMQGRSGGPSCKDVTPQLCPPPATLPPMVRVLITV